MSFPFENGWTETDIEAALVRNEPAELLHVPILVSLSPPDCTWAQDICVRLATHEHAQTRANAILGFGHLARMCGALDEARVRPLVEAGLRDPEEAVRMHADTAASDIRFFLGWAIGE